MAIGIHVVTIAVQNVDATGTRIDKNNSTIKDMLNTELRHLVVPDTNIPNSAGWPTVKRYLELEAAQDYILGDMTQTMIVTYDAGAINSAT